MMGKSLPARWGLVWAMASSVASWAAEPLLVPLGVWAPTGAGVAYQVQIVGTRAYVAAWDAGLHILDVSDPAAPVRIGGYNTAGQAYGVAVQGQYAFVADWARGLQIIDVSDPANPALVGNIGTTAYCKRVKVVGNYAYAANGLEGLVVIDVADPAKPKKVGSLNLGNAMDLQVADEYAYVADYELGLVFVDVSDPIRPKLAGLRAGTNARGVHLDGNFAYLARGFGGLEIVRRVPGNPVPVGTFDTPGHVEEVFAAGSRAFVADGSKGLHVLDLTDLANPLLLESVDTPGTTYDVQLVGSLVYAADGEGGVRLFRTRVQAIDFASLPDRTPAMSPFTLVATASSGLPLTFRVLSGPATLDGATVTLTGLGQVVIRAEQAGNESFEPAFVDRSFQVRRKTQTINFGALADRTVLDAPVTLSATASSGLAITFRVLSGPATLDGNVVTVTGVGEVVIRAEQAGNESFEPAFVDRSFQVRKKEQTVNFAALSDRLVSDSPIVLAATASSGLPVTFRVLEGPATIEGNVVTLTNVGTVVIRAEQGGSDQYTAAYVDRSFIVTAGFFRLTVTASGGRVTVDPSQPTYASNTVVSLRALASTNSSFKGWSGDASGAQTPISLTMDRDKVVHADFTELELLSSWPGFARGSVGAVQVVGNYAYAVCGASGLTVLDVSDPARPTRVGGFNTKGVANAVHVVGDRAYVADGPRCLQILDVSDPARPVRLGAAEELGGDVYDVRVSGEYAYLAADAAGLVVVQVADDTRPSYVGGYGSTPTARGVFVARDRAYVADATTGLHIFSVSTPANPRKLANLRLDGQPQAVRVAGNLAFVACGFGGLRIVDVSDPAKPLQVGALSTGGAAEGIFLAGDYAYVADGQAGLRIVDIRDPAHPLLAGTDSRPARHCAVAGTRAYLATYLTGLQVLDVGDPAHPSPLGAYQSTGYAHALQVAGDHAFVADDVGGLRIVNVSDPLRPAVAGLYSTAGWVWNLQVIGTTAYLASGREGIEIVDLLDPAHPVRLGGYKAVPSAEARDIEVVGRKAYVVQGRQGFQVLDVGNPAQPVPQGQPLVETKGEMRSVTVVNGFAYVANYDAGLLVYDVRTTPRRVGSLDTPGYAEEVKVAGTTAFVADGSAGIRLIDISNPAALRTLSSIAWSNGYAQGVTVIDTDVYVADRLLGVHAYRPDPQSGAYVRRFTRSTPGTACGLHVAANRLFVADGEEGLSVMGFGVRQTIDFPELADRLAGDPPLVLNPTANSGLPVTLRLVSGPARLEDKTLVLTGIGEVVVQAEQAGNADWLPAVVERRFQSANALYRLDLAVRRGRIDATPFKDRYAAGETVVLRVTPDTNCVFLRWTGDASGTESRLTLRMERDRSVQAVCAGPHIVGEVTAPGAWAMGVGLAGPYAYVGGSTGFVVYDITNPARLTSVAVLPGVPLSSNLCVAGNYVLSVSGPLLHAIDISNPSAPALAGSFRGETQLRIPRLAGSRAIVGTASSNLLVMDVSVPTNMAVVGTYRSGSRIVGLDFDGDLAVLGTVSGVEVLDLNDPAAPALVGSLRLQKGSMYEAAGQLTRGHLTYLVSPSAFRVIDTTDPTDPQRLGTARVGGICVRVSGHHAFVGTINHLELFDIRNPNRPVHRGWAGIRVFDLAVAGRYVYVASGTGLTVLGLGESQTIDFPPLRDRALRESPFALAATSSNGLPVSYRVVAGPAEVEGNVVRLTGLGQVTIAADQLGDDDYLPAYAERSFVAGDFADRVAFWIATQSPTLPEDQRGLLSDPDGDGALNILEYFFGSNPGEAHETDGRLPLPAVVREGDNAYVVLAFSLNPDVVPALGWSVETSRGLAAEEWQPLPNEQVAQDGNVVQVRVPLAGESPCRFFRLKLTPPP